MSTLFNESVHKLYFARAFFTYVFSSIGELSNRPPSIGSLGCLAQRLRTVRTDETNTYAPFRTILNGI